MSDSLPDAPDSAEQKAGSGERKDDAPRSEEVVRGGAAAEGRPAGAEDRAEALVGTVLAGRYRIDQLIGTGGMGAVYRAEHVHMRKAVAIKVLHKEMTFLPEVVARFEREAVAAARIEHPHVAAATDFGRLDDGSFYLVLEYVEGRRLRDLVKREAPLDPSRAMHIARQIAEALGAAHGAGIVHRDLKPENVMLVFREGDQDFVKVLDFGIAKVNLEDTQNQPQLTQVGSVFGTPEYMSPEQAAGQTVDARADLYTLGILLYEMLSGATPFAADDLLVVLTRQMTEAPPPLSQEIPGGVRQVVSELLVKDPLQRTPNAAELIQRIDALGEPVPERGPPSFASSPFAEPAPSSPGVSSTVDDESGSGSTVAVTAPDVRPPMPSSAASPALPEAAESPAQPAASPAPPGAAPSPPAPPVVAKGALGNLSHRARETVHIGGQPIPLWLLLSVIGSVSLLVGIIVVMVVALASGTHPGATSASASAVAAAPPELAGLVKRAEAGDRKAIYQLRQRPEKGRSAAEWRALARGFAKIKFNKPSMDAYGYALAADPALAKEAETARDVRLAAAKSDAMNEALDIAAHQLGAVGVDILYDVVNSTKAPPVAVAQAKKLLDNSAVVSHASPALKTALDLKAARGCGGYKKLLPAAAEHADARSYHMLLRLTVTRGCGFLGLGDCWSCLRGSGNLSTALKRAKSHPAPTFQ